MAVSSWNLGRSYKLHIRIVPRVGTMRVGIYMAHGWTRSKRAEQLEAKGKKKVVMKSSQNQAGSVCTGEDEQRSQSRSNLSLLLVEAAWLGKGSFPDPGFCFVEGGVCDEFSDAARGNLAFASPASHPRSMSPVPVCPACFAP